MSDETLKLPPDFMWSDDGEGRWIKHRVSGKRAHWPDWMPPPRQTDVDFVIRKVRIEYRRDRLYWALGKDIDAFRRRAITMRLRGYMI
jgi:hypothetical protein